MGDLVRGARTLDEGVRSPVHARPLCAVFQDANHREMHESRGGERASMNGRRARRTKTSGAETSSCPTPAGLFARVGFARGRQRAREGGGGVARRGRTWRLLSRVDCRPPRAFRSSPTPRVRYSRRHAVKRELLTSRRTRRTADVLTQLLADAAAYLSVGTKGQATARARSPRRGGRREVAADGGLVVAGLEAE